MKEQESHVKRDSIPDPADKPLLSDKHEMETDEKRRDGIQSSRILALCRKSAQRVCSIEFLKERLPPLGWAPSYDLDMLTGDFIAGVTTALTVIPQGIGYAPLAGLPLQYGLYASIVPGFTYCLLGTTRQATIGPTAVNSIMSFNYAGGIPYKAVTLAFFSGIIEILCGILNLGFLIQYISQPVVTAFSSAVCIQVKQGFVPTNGLYQPQVITSQVKGLLGITGIKGRGFVNVWVGVFSNLTSIQWYDTAVSAFCMIVLYFLRRLKEFDWCEGKDPEAGCGKVMKKTKWLLSISANCLVVVITSILAWLLVSVGIDLFSLTGEVDQGLPAWQLPWQFNRNTTANGTDEVEGPVQLAGELGVGLLMLPLVSILQHLAIAKHYAGQNTMAASQEMLALGVSQMVGSFTGSIAVTASFGRSAVNSTSGVRTTFGGVFTALIIILACAFLSPYLAFIPTAALSAVIVFSMFFTINYSMPKDLWKAKKLDLLPYTVTFLLGLFWSVEMGLIVGCLLHLSLLLYQQSKPSIQSTKEEGYTLFSPQTDLSFPGVEHLRQQFTTASKNGKVILDLGLVRRIDFTAARALATLVKGVRAKGDIVEVCCSNEEVLSTLTNVYGEEIHNWDTVQDAIHSVNSDVV